MATAAISQTKHPERARQRDRLFFSGMALLVLIAVAVGFARTYFLAGAFWANSPALWFMFTARYSLFGLPCL